MDETKISGTLQAVKEKQIILVDEDLYRINLDSKEIDVIKLRRVGSMGRGAWIGAASGIVAGALVGAASHDENDLLLKEASMGGGGVLGLLIGTGLGIGIGSAKKKLVVNGDENAYRLHLPVLREYAPQTSTKESIEGGMNSQE